MFVESVVQDTHHPHIFAQYYMAFHINAAPIINLDYSWRLKNKYG